MNKIKWFKHMGNLRDETRIKRLIKKYGLTGYGLYNLILELITGRLSEDFPYPVLEETCADIARRYKEDSNKITEMVNFMIDNELIDLDKTTGNIACYEIYKYLDEKQKLGKYIIEIIKKIKD